MARSISFVVVVLGLLTACGPEAGSGVMGSEDFQVDEFTKVRVAEGLTVEVMTGARRVNVTADDNLIDSFKFDVDGKTLKISRDGGRVQPTFARIVISAPSLERLEAVNKSNITATEISATNFEIDARDESRIFAAGLTRDLDIDCHGQSVVDTGALSAGKAKVDVSGQSLVTVNATSELEIDASGNSRVLVSGNPTQRNVDADPGSEVVFGTQ
ncbi:MAG TPA: DUF2807 domain-containing protein [Archangium sp.]